MDSFATPDAATDVWNDEFARAIDSGRRRALEMLVEQQQRIDSLEANLASEIEQIIAETQTEHSPEEQEKRDRLAAELSVRETFLAGRLSELEAREAFLRHGELNRSCAEQALAADKRELALARERLEKDRDELTAQRADLTAQRAAAELQRRRIARKLKTEWSAQREAIQRRKRELKQLADDHHGQLQAALETARASLEEERKQKDHLRRLLRERMIEARDLRRKVKRLEADAALRAAESCELKAAHELLARQSTDRQLLAEQLAAQAQLQAEHDRTAAEGAPAAREANRAAFDQKFDDLQRRFEMAIADLRQYKHRNAELEARLGPDDGSRSDGAPNWETRKQRILAALELEPPGDESFEARITIEGAIRLTDELIAQKDREIAELKAVLADQSSNLGSIAVGAAAIAEILDHDELVCQERQRLKQLQEECNDKLRSAEIEISLERARLARAWAELDDRLSRARPATEPGAECATSALGGSKSTHGRWWAFLGLKDSGAGGA